MIWFLLIFFGVIILWGYASSHDRQKEHWEKMKERHEEEHRRLGLKPNEDGDLKCSICTKSWNAHFGGNFKTTAAEDEVQELRDELGI